MQHLPNQRSKLFLLAHELMQKEPESPVSSYAVAAWYIFSKKYPIARRWIAWVVYQYNLHKTLTQSFETSDRKTTLMDPRNGPAWIAFAHTFAFEGEHDQAVTAYSTCARLFRGWMVSVLAYSIPSAWADRCGYKITSPYALHRNGVPSDVKPTSRRRILWDRFQTMRDWSPVVEWDRCPILPHREVSTPRNRLLT